MNSTLPALVVLGLLALACRPEGAAPSSIPKAADAAQANAPPSRAGDPDAADLDGADLDASPTPPTEDPMPTPDALEPPWSAACQIAKDHLGDEPIRSCVPVAPGGARAPFLLSLRTERQKRRLLVHEGQVVTERGPEALSIYLRSLGFPGEPVDASILWELVMLFDVLPEAWRFGPIPDGRWDKPAEWMRAVTLYYRPGEPAVALTSSPKGATFVIHRTLQPGDDPLAPLPGGGVKKDEDRRLTLTFDASAKLGAIKIERREGAKWRAAR